jgi:hypothetical protein
VNRLLRAGFVLRRHRFKARISVICEGVGARGGPEQLIKMATGQPRGRVQHEAAAAPPNTVALNNALDHRGGAGPVTGREPAPAPSQLSVGPGRTSGTIAHAAP